MYNWDAVDTDKLAPDGWHVATDDDWELTLVDYLVSKDIEKGDRDYDTEKDRIAIKKYHEEEYEAGVL